MIDVDKSKDINIIRFLYETRLYSSPEESLFRSIVWFITWGIGIYAYHTIKQPYAIIPNYIAMAGSYMLDVYYNLFTNKKRKRDHRYSRTYNVIFLLVSNLIIIMAALQLFDIVGSFTIKDERFYLGLFALGIILILKPFVDFILLLIFPESANEPSIYQTLDKTDSSQEHILSEEYKKELERAGQSGHLTDNNKG